MRHAFARDENHATIKAAFEAYGCFVIDISDSRTLGCDLIVYRENAFMFGYRAVSDCIAIEIKDGSKPPSARKLKPSEEKFRDRCRAKRMPWQLVESVEDVKKLMEGA